MNFALGAKVSVCLLPLFLFPLSGCSTLPDSGPTAGQVQGQAGGDSASAYQYVDIDPSVIEVLTKRNFESLAARFGDQRMTREPPIGVGDSVAVSIWEASASGLFSAATSGERLAANPNTATIPEQVVGRDGGITIPYAGRIHVAGAIPRNVERQIQEALKGKAVDPQILVSVTRAISNTVAVQGEVGVAQRETLTVGGDRLLDVLAAAGGVRGSVNEVSVDLSRGNVTSRVPLSRIVANPKENIYLHPKDTLTLVRDPQTFIAYGATGRDAQIPFESDSVSLGEALAKAGGLMDNRSDPAGVFVFRYENATIANALRPDAAETGNSKLIPVVYHLNLRNADALFLQQNFRIANHDVIYVSNSLSTIVSKAFDIVSPSLGTAGSAATIASETVALHP